VFHYGKSAGRDFTLADLERDGFDNAVLMVGAQRSKTLGLDDEDCDGVIDALLFLRQAREKKHVDLGKRIGIIGAGDTAMDCARVAKRLSGNEVILLYRRTIDQMPADREEIAHLLEEGTEVIEMSKPQRLVVRDGRLQGVICRRMEYRGDRDASGRKIPHEVPGTEFEVPLDTLILAISQTAILEFLGDVPVELNDRGYIRSDPETFETTMPGIYAGGDVANDGPASIVKAAAAGKAIADHILGKKPAAKRSMHGEIDKTSLLRRKSHREWRVPAPQLALEDRHGFEEVVLTYDEQQARDEASRCLDCDLICSLCVGVCPNLALQTWEVDPAERSAGQRYQVAVLADLCNECGNCTTFCPTSGEPWHDKPRLYLDRDEFEAQDDNAFMVFHDDGRWSMDARHRGSTVHVELDDEPGDAEPLAAMRTLLGGIRHSMPDLPMAEAGRRQA
jgi:putative selenate reductase